MAWHPAVRPVHAKALRLEESSVVKKLERQRGGSIDTERRMDQERAGRTVRGQGVTISTLARIWT